MRKYAVLFITAVAVLIVAAFALSNTLFVMQRLARVEEAAGTVELKPRGESEWRPIGETPNVKTGDALRTGDESFVVLSWVDGTRMKLDANTCMVIEKCRFNGLERTQESLFRLDFGRIWVRVIEALTRRSKFEVETPAATAGIRGTIFSVDVADDGATRVAVYEGEVSVSAANARTIVPRGQSVSVRRDGSDGRVAAMDDAELERWEAQHNIVMPHLALNPPVKAPDRGGDLEISGEAEPGATVTVNGAPAQVTGLGAFRATVPSSALDGEQSIEVVATDHSGASRTATITP